MSDLADLVASRMEADPGLSEDVKLLVLEALVDGDEPAGIEGPQLPGEGPGPDRPAGAYLQRIAVRGFRGIGPEALLDLHPGPGLTVVAGRNGSGKSSFAEALEVALTGTTYRWSRRTSRQWQEAWRNLHTQDPPRAEVTLAEEGVGPTRVTVEWLGEAVDDTVTNLQRRGERRQEGISALGWDGPMKTFRPLLTYDELGALLSAEPSRLHDELSTVLGLDQIGDAIKRLAAQSKELAAPGTALTQERRDLQQVLNSGDDERALKARALLDARTVDTAALRSLATGTSLDTDNAAHLREIAGLRFPDAQTVGSAAARLKEAASGVVATADAASEALDRRVDLLNAALRVHHHDGDLVCPVCEQGRLDTARAEVLRRDVETASVRLGQLREARNALVSARRMAQSLVTPPPDRLARPLSGDLEPLRVRALEAWKHWADIPDDDLALAEHLLDRSGPATDALSALRTACEAESDSRDRQWASIASRLAAYADKANEWARLNPQSDAAKGAAKWLKETEVAIKNERMAPIAKHAAEIWAGLRQESNVELSGLSLEGTATRRRVKIATSVDGVDGHGAAVLSQGEIHALALALFLPRATMDESPFRFVVLDDPVQAMDPAKVDGLVSELSRIAENRQVVVFSHDDRLAAAVRRSAAKATIHEVTREAGSKVTVSNTHDPAHRYLQDAYAMTRDDGLPEWTLRKVLPGMLRMAAEAAAYDRYFGHGLAKGESHTALEDQWTNHQRTSQRISLALYGDVRDLGGWLAKDSRRRQALGICTTAVHTGLVGPTASAYGAVKKVVDDIKRGVL